MITVILIALFVYCIRTYHRRLSVSQSVCLSLCLSLSLSLSASVCLFFCVSGLSLSLPLSLFLPFCLSMFQVYLSLSLSGRQDVKIQFLTHSFSLLSLSPSLKSPLSLCLSVRLSGEAAEGGCLVAQMDRYYLDTL